MSRPIRYLPLLEQLDRWQADARIRHPGVIPCRTGCSACCHGPFDISIADVALIAEAVALLPADVRAEVVERARSQLAAMQAIEPQWAAPFDIGAIGEARFDRVSDELAELPCPMLDQAGACLIYHDRPMICRLMGLGLVTERGDVIENGCPIQERFPAYERLEPQPFPLEAWESDEDEARADAAIRLGDAGLLDYETTIAAAVVSGLTPGPRYPGNR